MHEVDVDAMLLRISPFQLRMWRAAYQAVPLGDSWHQSDTICRTIHDCVEKILAVKAGLTAVHPDNFAKPGDYIPHLSFTPRAKIRVDEASIAASQRATEQRY